MYLKIHSTFHLQGKVTPPSSKSQGIRGMMFASLAKGTSMLRNPLVSEDMQDAVRVCQALNVYIENQAQQTLIRSSGLPLVVSCDSIHTGNSGITTCFLLPILGLRQNTERPIRVECGEQMRARPIRSLIEALRSLGMKIDYASKEGALPVMVSGALEGGQAEIDGITSQYLSALLIALPCAKRDSEVVVNNLQERPYVQMTLDWLKQQHIHHYQLQAGKEIYRIQGNQDYMPFESTIAGDFSSASSLIASAVMIPGNVEVQGLNMQDSQGDKRLVTILQSMGADIKIEASGLRIRGGEPLQGNIIDANDIPDLLPTLAVIGTYARGKTEIRNAAQARFKETDRIHSMSEGLKALGAQIEEWSDGMTVYQSPLQGCSVKGFGDHRTVMALAVAGLLAKGSTWIDTAHAIHKTFPNFVEIMQEMGAKIEYCNE